MLTTTKVGSTRVDEEWAYLVELVELVEFVLEAEARRRLLHPLVGPRGKHAHSVVSMRFDLDATAREARLLLNPCKVHKRDVA